MSAKALVHFTCDGCGDKDSFPADPRELSELDQQRKKHWVLVAYGSGDTQEHYCRPTCAARHLSRKSGSIVTPDSIPDATGVCV